MRALFLGIMLLVTASARAETLLVEIDFNDTNACCINTFQQSLSWEFYNSPGGIGGTYVREDLIGVKSRQAIGPSGVLSQWYREWDFTVENPSGASHVFFIEGGGDGIASFGLSPHKLFTQATYTQGSSQTVTVTPHITLPNGNSFVGTDWYFTAVEFEVLDVYNSSTHGDTERRRIAIRFFGVPEPTSALLLFASSLPLAFYRRRIIASE